MLAITIRFNASDQEVVFRERKILKIRLSGS